MGQSAKGTWLAALALLGVLTIVGCAGQEAPAPAAPTEVLQLRVVEARYSCVGPPGFLPSLLDGPATAELESHPSAKALRSAVAAGLPGPDVLPHAGYWLASRDASRAEYIARAEGDFPFVSATLTNEAGGWSLTGWGDCKPTIVLKELNNVTWAFDPTLPTPDAATTAFAVLVSERACTGGQAIGRRLLAPAIDYSVDSISVVFAAIPPRRGLMTCPGIAPERAHVQLSEPLGDRRLFDGALFPPGDPAHTDF